MCLPGRKLCHVRLNAPVQELEHNIMQFRNSTVMVDSVPVQYERHSSMAERQWQFQRQRHRQVLTEGARRESGDIAHSEQLDLLKRWKETTAYKNEVRVWRGPSIRSCLLV